MPLVLGSIRSTSPPTSLALCSSNVCQPGLASVQLPPQLALLNEIVLDTPPLLPQAVSDAVAASTAMVSKHVFRIAMDSIDSSPSVAETAGARPAKRSLRAHLEFPGWPSF